jgi:two-component system, LytTR family, response regulator
VPLSIIIADDEPLAIDRLRALLDHFDDVALLGTARNASEMVALIEEVGPDLVLLDIQMPGRSGIAAVGALPLEGRPDIVFVTAHEQFAADAFDLDATDYLLKPVRLERLRLAIERARRRQQARSLPIRVEEPPITSPSAYDDAIWVPVADGQIRVPVASIEWVEAQRDYALLHTNLRSYMLRTTMAALEERLDPSELLRVHRSAFVRKDAVRALTRVGRGHEITLDAGVHVPVGVNYLARLEREIGLSQPINAD